MTNPTVFQFLLLISTSILLPEALTAGLCTTGLHANDYRHEFQFFAGYSPQSSTLIGTTVDRRFALAGFSYSYTCWSSAKVSLAYTAGVLPVAVLFEPSEYFYDDVSRTGSIRRFSPSHAVYGVGVTPIGLTADFLRTRKLHPFFQADGGIIASTEPIPANVANATGLNFLFDFGGGAQWRLDKRHAIKLGYKFLHISNAGTTSANPGVDNNVFYVGFSLLK